MRRTNTCQIIVIQTRLSLYSNPNDEHEKYLRLKHEPHNMFKLIFKNNEQTRQPQNPQRIRHSKKVSYNLDDWPIGKLT